MLACLCSCLLFLLDGLQWAAALVLLLLFLLCISTWVYCHSNHKYSTILFKGRFAVIISILCFLFFISEQACVQFALLSCHWYSTIFSALFSHAYDIFLSVTSSIWKCGTFCWCFLFSHWENEWSMQMKGRKGEAPKKNVDVDRSYVTNDEWKPTINNNQNNAKVSAYTHIQWVVFYPLEKKEARFFRRLLFTFYLILQTSSPRRSIFASHFPMMDSLSLMILSHSVFFSFQDKIFIQFGSKKCMNKKEAPLDSIGTWDHTPSM